MSDKQGNTDFESIFKSEAGGHSCPNCHEDLVILKSEEGIIVKSRKKKSGKGRGARAVGNLPEPHKGGKTGSRVPVGAKAKSGMAGGVQRRATQPSNPTVEKSEDAGEEKAPLFPFRKSFALTAYDGNGDSALAKSIETDGHGGVVDPARNLAMEKEALAKGGKSKSDEDTEAEESTDEDTEVTSDEESSDDE